jgi:tetratricopeptide (TPR) repeat protein
VNAIRASSFVLVAALALAGCADEKKEQQLVDSGKALIAQGKYEAAAAELTKATAENRNSMQAWLQLGHAYRGMKKYDEALAAYVTAKQADRMAVAPHLAHAGVQIELGNLGRAIQELTLVTEMDPKNLEALKTLGRISQMPHKQPDGSTAVTKLDLERAELNLEAAAAIAPNDAEVAAELAKVRAALGRK